MFVAALFFFAIIVNASEILAGRWTEVPGANLNDSGLYDVAVVSANDVWAVGSLATRAQIEHWDGTSWSVVAVQPPGTLLNGVAALSSNDIWAVGQNGAHNLVEHWNGQRWVRVPSPSIGTYDVLTAVCAISHEDASAVGYSIPFLYSLMHWDGTSWSVVNGPPANSSALVSIKAFATDDVWAVGYKDFNSFPFTSSTFTLHWDGTDWREIASPTVSDQSFLSGVDGATSDDVWAVGTQQAGALAMH